MAKPITMDPTKVVSHKDCYIKATVNNQTYVFAEAETFTATVNFNAVDVQPMGEALVSGVPTGYTITIALTEFVVRDDVTVQPLLDALAKGIVPIFIFEGVIDRVNLDGQESRQTYRNCIPADSWTVLNFTPGEVVKRELNFRCNATPELVKALQAA